MGTNNFLVRLGKNNPLTGLSLMLQIFKLASLPRTTRWTTCHDRDGLNGAPRECNSRRKLFGSLDALRLTLQGSLALEVLEKVRFRVARHRVWALSEW